MPEAFHRQLLLLEGIAVQERCRGIAPAPLHKEGRRPGGTAEVPKNLRAKFSKNGPAEA
jgi:hypothetical protein